MGLWQTMLSDPGHSLLFASRIWGSISPRGMGGSSWLVSTNNDNPFLTASNWFRMVEGPSSVQINRRYLTGYFWKRFPWRFQERTVQGEASVVDRCRCCVWCPAVPFSTELESKCGRAEGRGDLGTRSWQNPDLPSRAAPRPLDCCFGCRRNLLWSQLV